MAPEKVGDLGTSCLIITSSCISLSKLSHSLSLVGGELQSSHVTGIEYNWLLVNHNFVFYSSYQRKTSMMTQNIYIYDASIRIQPILQLSVQIIDSRGSLELGIRKNIALTIIFYYCIDQFIYCTSVLKAFGVYSKRRVNVRHRYISLSLFFMEMRWGISTFLFLRFAWTFLVVSLGHQVFYHDNKIKYSHALHKDISVSDGPHMQWCSHKIIISCLYCTLSTFRYVQIHTCLLLYYYHLQYSVQ